MTERREITVIVPVYRGREEVRRCIESVLRHPAEHHAVDLLVIDDASPDAELHDDLDALMSPPSAPPAVPVTVLRNEENLGFVATVNRGIEQSTGDVVVLNADTIVTADWIDRLADAASGDGVGTVTPLSNFGSLCTVPSSIITAFELDGAEPRIDDCADFIGRNTVGLRPEVISGVGFCLYITREALDATGLFDVETFGKGYGEEVDFCLRATRLGFRHVVEDATFVYHVGGVSFGDEREAGRDRGSALVHARYPDFRAANAHERRHDPLAVSFAALELGLVERRTDRPHVLHILHGTPDSVGGTEKHLWALIDALSDEFDFSIFYPVASGFALRTIWNLGPEDRHEEDYLFPGAARVVTRVLDEVAAAALALCFDLFDFDAVHIQHLKGNSLAVLDVLTEFDGPVVCSVRDLYPACPQYSLLYRDVEPCGIPEDLTICERCLPVTQELSRRHLEEFREAFAERLGVVDQWVFASQSAADFFLRVYDVEPAVIELIPHGAIIDPRRPDRQPDTGLIFDEPLRLAFVGRGWDKKGLGLVNHLAGACVDSTIEVHHFGATKEPASPELIVHGPYDNERLPELLRLTGIGVVLLPGAYAETFGHVMTEALLAGLPVVGARYGALGERIRTLGVGWTVDPMKPDELVELVQRLDQCREEVWRATRQAADVAVDSVAATADRYAAMYRTPRGGTVSSRIDGGGGT